MYLCPIWRRYQTLLPLHYTCLSQQDSHETKVNPRLPWFTLYWANTRPVLANIYHPMKFLKNVNMFQRPFTRIINSSSPNCKIRATSGMHAVPVRFGSNDNDPERITSSTSLHFTDLWWNFHFYMYWLRLHHSENRDIFNKQKKMKKMMTLMKPVITMSIAVIDRWWMRVNHFWDDIRRSFNF